MHSPNFLFLRFFALFLEILATLSIESSEHDMCVQGGNANVTYLLTYLLT